jgi:hypothetical protein
MGIEEEKTVMTVGNQNDLRLFASIRGRFFPASACIRVHLRFLTEIANGR